VIRADGAVLDRSAREPGTKLSTVLRSARRVAGLTQLELAGLAGISIGTVRDLEQGRRLRPRPDSLARLAGALSLDVSPASELVQAAHGLATGQPGGGPRQVPARSVWLQVLGPLACWRGGARVPLGPARQRATLGLLALNPGSLVRRETVIDALWDEDPPASAVNLTQAHVGRLRRALDPGRSPRDGEGLLASAGIGYRLQVSADQLDSLAFLRLAGRARAARVSGHAVTACDLYEQALALWQGDPLADVDLLRGNAAVTELASQRSAVVIEYAESACAARSPDRVLPHLRALAAREPLDERAHAQLMLALAACGQQAAALQVFEDIRRRLDVELGILPGPEICAAQARVLRQEHEVLPHTPAAGRPVTVAAPVAGAVAGSPPADGVLPVCQLPPDISDFTGRASECAVLAKQLTPAEGRTAVPVAVVSGPPGAGKTSLALHVAHSLRPLFADGQLHVQLAGASASPRAPGEVLGELLRALGVAPAAIPETEDARSAMFRSRLADRHVLLLADDASSAAQVRPLLPGTAGCAVVVTSRDRMAGLAAGHLHLESLHHEEALQMLGRIAGEQRVAGDPDAAARLVAACGYLPLAVRIAGARLAARPAWPLATLTALICDKRRRLDELAAGDLAVRANAALSYQALDPPARRAFRSLTLAGPHDVAGWVVAALLGRDDAADVVNLLVDKSLLAPVGVDGAGQPRYRLHDLLRDYAAEHLAEQPEPERAAAWDRLLRAWLELAGSAGQAPSTSIITPRRSATPNAVCG
jgi:DNA-binding SARP family transcriptional activator/transcriptional regulator with XRE-family HTH domain